MMSDDERRDCGLKGYEFLKQEDVMMTSEAMSNNFIKQMDNAFSKWKPRKRYTIYKA